MPHLEDFFTHGDHTNLCTGSINALDDVKFSHREDDDHHGVKNSGVLYLYGPKQAGQTSLLLQFGFTQVQAGKNVVLIMCGEAGVSQKPMASDIVPLTPCSACNQPVQTGANNSIWRRITIKYLRNNAELQRYLCSFHGMDTKNPSVLLIDGFEQFFATLEHNSDMGNVYQTLAFLLEAQDYMKISTGFGMTVVTGHWDAFVLGNRPLLRRWCRFVELVSSEEEPNVFIMREGVEEKDVHVDKEVARTQVKYMFAPETSGTFQLLHVQTRSE
ncbi:unnamed protein product [Peronospora belbahrii]|uniref:DNA recombination and repair protein Rad51-like C-terminal domain-containing protein n=1 Tax=Peronospora belbahrii TaxID=622444 RepID=A0ABN8CST3_9STRA|nr:unnamed protein product [Peronospora belbahrii]